MSEIVTLNPIVFISNPIHVLPINNLTENGANCYYCCWDCCVVVNQKI